MLTAVLGRSVMAERYGATPAAVLALHGWGRSRADFDVVLAGLDALAVDLPGFGTSAPPPGAWSTADYATALSPLLTELDRPVLVGHSFGGRVAAHLAAEHPTRIRGVVFTGVPLLRPEQQPPARVALRYRLARRLNGSGLLSDTRMEAARRRHGSADYRAATGVMREILVRAVNEDYGDQLDAMARARVPVRLVWGAGDAAVPPAAAAAAAARLGDTDPVLIGGSGHLLDPDLAGGVRRAVDELLLLDSG